MSPNKVFVVGIGGKAVMMGGVVGALDVGFVKSIVLVLVSAGATGIFGVVVAIIQRAEVRDLRRVIDRMEARQVDIGGAVGAAKRRDDPADEC